MNPNTTIRPWLLACGAQFGINNAYDYRCPDEETRPYQMYFTYRFIEMRELSVASIDMSTAPASGYNLDRKIAKPFDTLVEIKLYNSQDGLFELAACVAALERVPAIRELFSGKAAYRDIQSLKNDSTWDSDRVDYEHTMIIRFEEIASIELEEINSVIEQIDLTLESDSHTWNITENGYE